jgi:hypothetical protein
LLQLLSLSKHNRTNATMVVGPVCNSLLPQAKLGQSNKPLAFKAPLASTKGSKDGMAKAGERQGRRNVTVRTKIHDPDDDDELPPSVFSKASIPARSASDPHPNQGSPLPQNDDSEDDDDLPPSVFYTKRSKVAAASALGDSALLDGSKPQRITSFLKPLEEMQAGESDEELSPSALRFEVSLHKASNHDSQDGLLRQRIPSFLKTSPKTMGNDVNKNKAAMKQAQIEEFRQLKHSSTATAAAAKDGAKKRKAKSSSGSSTGTLSLQSSRSHSRVLLTSREKYNCQLASVLLDGDDSDGASDDESYFRGRTKEALAKRRRHVDDDCADSITTTFTSSQSVTTTTQSRREPKQSKTLSRARRPFQTTTSAFRPSPLEIRKTTTSS